MPLGFCSGLLLVGFQNILTSPLGLFLSHAGRCKNQATAGKSLNNIVYSSRLKLAAVPIRYNETSLMAGREASALYQYSEERNGKASQRGSLFLHGAPL